MAEGNPDRPAGQDRARVLAQTQPSYDTSTMFGTGREVIIVHKGEHYRLRLTQSGKLILTK